MLTPRQKDVLAAIEEFVSKEGFAPTVRELAAKLGVSSTCTIYKHLKALERKDYIARRDYKSRGVRVVRGLRPGRGRQTTVSVPLVGRVAAGVPLYAEENIEEYLPLAKTLTGQDEVFLLRIKGDSMVEDGISDGDLVLVRQQDYAEDGDVVVALVEDEATVKRFFHEDGRFRLQPSNQAMSPIIYEEVKIVGKVLFCIHRV